MLRTPLRLFTTFESNPSTSTPSRGPPRGYVNRLIAMGLPPWASYTQGLSRRTIYHLANPSPGVRPAAPNQLKEIWMNEYVRTRVRSSKNYHHVFQQLKHPHMMSGLWYSDVLDHWVQIPHVQQAYYAIEKKGGIDNFIMSTPGEELKSTYGERLRRHLLVRKKEIEKNFILEKQAEALAAQMYTEYKQNPSAASEKYQLN
eukprot:PhM_4_TR15990/c0_g1_i1/m.93853